MHQACKDKKWNCIIKISFSNYLLLDFNLIEYNFCLSGFG